MQHGEKNFGVFQSQKEIVDVIKFLIKSTKLGFFILGLLIWRVFLWNPFFPIVDKISEKWTPLSENYKILILGFIGTIIAGTIAQVIGMLLFDKIKSVLKKGKL